MFNSYTIWELGETMAWLEGTDYFWVVLCKNRGVHNKYNHFSRHAIPLAETDEVSSLPQIGALTVRCDDCGEEYTYDAKDILRAELEQPESFTPHPLFQESGLKPALTADASAPGSVSTIAPGKTTVLERIRAAVEPYLRFRRKESPPPRWRRPRSDN